MKVNVKFQSEPDIAKAQVATKLCQASSMFIKLPDYIEILFVDMEDSVYGEAILSNGISRKIMINNSLSLNEIIYPITHELLHLNQLYEGRLSASRTGVYVWEGMTYKIDIHKISYTEYMNLPWEIDVLERQKTLIEQILS